MKTKLAEEIAARLVDYVCAKGPYKRMPSDNESALMSDILNKFKSAIGLKWHKTVVSYSPSHGMIERFVGTFGNAMRKLSEDNRMNWRAWIPFIKLIWRTRVHSVTKMTPYETMYGIKCNHFESWTEHEGETVEQALAYRALQLQTLIKSRNELKLTIERAQEKQKDKQNLRTKRILRYVHI